jgi:myosin-5
MADLDTRRTEVLGRSASIIQRKVRSYLAKKSFIVLRNSAKQIQSVCRGIFNVVEHVYSSTRLNDWIVLSFFYLLTKLQTYVSAFLSGYLARSVYEGMRREAAALKIQRDLRRFLARKAYTELYSAAVSVQAGMRGMVARKELCFRRQTKAAIIIQVHLNQNCRSVALLEVQLVREHQLHNEIDYFTNNNKTVGSSVIF